MDDTTMQNILLFVTAISPMTIALTQLVKKTMNIPKNIISWISLFIGVLLGVAGYLFTDLALDARIWAGAIAGLSAVGLFEVGSRQEGMTKVSKDRNF